MLRLSKHADPLAPFDQRGDDVRTDEAGAAGDQMNGHPISIHAAERSDQR